MKLRTGVPLALLVAACALGCSQPGTGNGVATAGAPVAAAASSAPEDGAPDEEQLRGFARCMRDHGVDMPDPQAGPNGELRVTINGGPGDEQRTEEAQQACRHLMPNGGEPPQLDPAQLEQQRAISRCMRENGVPGFPDPEPNGRIRIQGGSGLDPSDPSFQAAQVKCDALGPAPGSAGGTARTQDTGSDG